MYVSKDIHVVRQVVTGLAIPDAELRTAAQSLPPA